MLEKGQVWEKNAGFIQVPFEGGWPATQPWGHIEEAAQCGL